MQALSRRSKIRLLAIAACVFVIGMTVGVEAREAGISGQSQIGCTCHGASSLSVVVTITGIPASYMQATIYPLTVSVSGGPATPNGGFDLSVTAGTLTTSDPNAQILNGEATHRSNAVRTWAVTWMAPPTSAGVVNFYVAGNAVNGDVTTSGDMWNTAVYTTIPFSPDQPPTISLTAPDGT